MKTLSRLLALLALLPALAFSQSSPRPARQDPALLAELNRDIWTPFAEAFADGQPEKFLALQAPDYIRILGNDRVIRPLAEYAAGVKRSFLEWNANEVRVHIGFRFTERIVSGRHASERGIYELVQSNEDGDLDRIYGRFHVISRKIDGRWRMVVDYDSDLGLPADLNTYRAATAPDDFRAF